MNRMSVSFSGGRTSAYMASQLVRLREQGWEVIFTFANTGQEDERTLVFVDRCDRHFGLDVVWLEAKVDPRPGRGTAHRIVDFASAARRGEPFEAVIAKYGIPNRVFQPCNRELKLRPMQSYRRSIGWRSGTYKTAVGIRADEIDRISSSGAKEGVFYPLIEWGITKAHVIRFWQEQPFDLYLPEQLGNCTWCWKKSKRKHLTLMLENSAVFDFPRRMELTYPFAGAGDGPRRFFRGNETTTDLAIAALFDDFEPFHDNNQAFDPELDVGAGCGESCDIFVDEFTDEEAA